MKFSQRIGKTSVKDLIQRESIDDNLKIKLWNIIYDYFLDYYWQKDSKVRYILSTKTLWTNFFIKKSNLYDKYKIHNFIESWFFKEAEWFEIYDFVERIALFQKELIFKTKFPINSKLNSVLEKELSAFRIINYKIIPVSDDLEIKSIEEASKNNDKFLNVSIHLNSALKFLSDRKSPDYRNSIKESISAVESICRIITGESTLGKALKKLEDSDIEIHQQLKNAFEKLYLFTNDKKTGIRHALIEEGYSPNFDEAKFMLVSCSAFINYLKSKSV